MIYQELFFKSSTHSDLQPFFQKTIGNYKKNNHICGPEKLRNYIFINCAKHFLTLPIYKQCIKIIDFNFKKINKHELRFK